MFSIGFSSSPKQQAISQWRPTLDPSILFQFDKECFCLTNNVSVWQRTFLFDKECFYLTKYVSVWQIMFLDHWWAWLIFFIVTLDTKGTNRIIESKSDRLKMRMDSVTVCDECWAAIHFSSASARSRLTMTRARAERASCEPWRHGHGRQQTRYNRARQCCLPSHPVSAVRLVVE